MTDIHRVTRPSRRRFLFRTAGGIVSYALGLWPTLSQPLHSTARIMVLSPGRPHRRYRGAPLRADEGVCVFDHRGDRAWCGRSRVMDVLKNSPADGSVMVLTPAVAVALYPHVYRSLSYDPQQDFTPVTTISTTSMLFVCGWPAGPKLREDTC